MAASKSKDELRIEIGMPALDFNISLLPQKFSTQSSKRASLKIFLRNNPKKHLIFDFDKTIVDLDFALNILRDMLKKGLKSLAPEVIEKYPSGSTFNLQNEAIAKYGESARKLILKIANDYEERFVGKVAINNDMVDFIKSNEKRYSMYIWSINTQKTIQKYSKLLGIDDCFKAIIARDDVDFIKYYPDGFYQIFDPAKQKRSDYLLIGDSDKSDGLAAVICGIDFYKVEVDQVRWEKL